MVIENTGDVTVSTGDIVFGTAGKGICLGVTSNTDANTLDDYEEGTWTANLTGLTSAPDATCEDAAAVYTKIGNVVYWAFKISDEDTTGASGSWKVTGLPFTAGSSQYFKSGAFGCLNQGLSSDHHWLELPSTNTIMYLFNVADEGSWQYEAITPTAGYYFVASGTYRV